MDTDILLADKGFDADQSIGQTQITASAAPAPSFSPPNRNRLA
jgi:hypothetical protein